MESGKFVTESKQKLMERNGFLYSISRMMYLSPKLKKVFSVEAVIDHTEEWIKQRIAERNKDWKVYLNTPQQVKLEKMIARDIKLYYGKKRPVF